MSEHVEVSRDEGQVAAFLGLANRILVGGGQTDGELAVVEITVGPGAGAPPHANTGEALGFYVVEGSLTFETEDGAREAAKGDFLYFPRGTGHSFTNPSERPARALLMATPAGFERFFVEAGEAFPDEAPQGPPPPEAVEALREIGARYDMELLVP